jgi:hypothetical protein
VWKNISPFNSADPAYCYGAIWDGNYSYFLGYPNQLTLCVFYYLGRVLFGSGNFLYFYIAQCIACVFIYYGLYKLTQLLFKNERVNLAVLLLLTVTLEPFFLTGFLYSDIISLSLAIWAICFQLKFLFIEKRKYVLLSFLLIGISMLFRTNMLIFFIGMIILYAVYFGKRNKKLLTFSLIGSFLCFLVFYQGPIIALKVAGYGDYAYPSSYWVSMSLQTEKTAFTGDKFQDNIRFLVNGGFFQYKHSLNDRVKEKYGEDEVKYKQNWSEFIDDDLKNVAIYYTEHPKEMVKHFVTKFEITWVDTDFSTYGFIGHNNKVEIAKVIQKFMNLEKVLVFLLTLGFVAIKRNKIRSYQMLPIIVFLGGFVFHVFLWETRARYVLPYFVISLPIAASCLYSVSEKFYSKFLSLDKGEVNQKEVG